MLGSADDLARAVTNLLANAIRHTEAGLAVRISGRPSRRTVTSGSTVVDRCGGIPEENLARVFDVGWRGNEARTGEDGAGLGLAIARGVVESHDGRIEVRNVAGGCRFAVDLPDPRAGQVARDNTAAHRDRGESMRILLTGAAGFIGRAVRRHLRAAGVARGATTGRWTRRRHRRPGAGADRRGAAATW